MYLKRIEVFGFKSFAEKTKLEFGPGVSMIVGPNGCGKSNIADAVRWVLGEQSAKSLRSKQMTDVIFNGTQNRPPLGMAEVSLVFDNSQGVLPVAFSEVIVTRKLYRSGESEYSINRSPCRLKDIRDLFADTGIGADGYSIIEQGRVEFIINSKPEERRELFEEAAGISKYKFRKEEALRKLERIHYDIDRVNDIISFHHQQLKALESAARKSRQYQKLKAELTRAEITQIIYSIDTNRQKIKTLSSELEPLLRDKQLNTTESDALLVEIEKVKIELIEIDKKIIETQDAISKAVSRIEIADSKITQANAIIETSEYKIKSRQEEIKKDSEEISRITIEENELTQKLESIQEVEADINSRYKNALTSYQEVSQKLSNWQSELDNLKNQLWSLMQTRSEKSNSKSKYESDLEHLNTQLKRLKTETDTNNSEIKKLQEELTKKNIEKENLLKEKETLNQSYSSVSLELSDLIQKSDTLKTQLARSKEAISLLEGELAALSNFESSDLTLNSIKALLTSGNTCRGPVIELISIKPGFEKLATVAIGEKAYYMIVPTENTARSCIRYLVENNFGAITFVVEDKLPQNIQKSKIFEIIETSPENFAVINYLFSTSYTSDDILYDGALMRGGARVTSTQIDIVFQKRQKERLLSEENHSFEAAKLELEKIDKIKNELEGKLDSIEKSRTQKDFLLRWYEKEVQQLQDLIEDKSKLQGILNSEFKTLSTEIETKKSRIIQLEGEIKTLEDKEKEYRQKLEVLTSNIEAIKPQEESHRKEFESVRLELLNLTPQVESLKNKLQLLVSRKSYLQNNIENNTREIQSWHNEIKSQTRLKSEQAENITSAQAEKISLQEKLEGLLKSREQKKSKLEFFELNLQKYTTQREALTDKIHTLELEIKTLNVEINSYLKRLSDEFQMTEDTARQQLMESLLDPEELTKLRKKLESLGAVNLAASEEYEELNKKYEFILSQKNDLEKAKEDLKEIINKINQTTKEQFLATFEKVRENFINTFSKLFEGGHADLVLTDENNILETGVEIIAQPPGKKLQSITQLSGGEKALTAVALLFAFYLVKPTPFCLLDEADAPLDEANVERFLNLLETFTDRSQFLIITHNKRTMLRADVIYGITMEEFGVSKTISMKFEEATTV